MQGVMFGVLFGTSLDNTIGRRPPSRALSPPSDTGIYIFIIS